METATNAAPLEPVKEIEPVREMVLKSRWDGFVIAGVLALVVGGTIVQYLQSEMLDRRLNSVTSEIQTLRSKLAATEVALGESKTMIDVLSAAPKDLAGPNFEEAISVAKREARNVERRMASNSARLSRENKELSLQLSQVKESTGQTAAVIGEKFTAVSAEVSGVKTEVATARADIDRTSGDLKRATGDLGVLSGLIATNSKEISALRRLGERDYTELNILKSAEPRRVGDISLIVKKVDTKRNRYTVEVLAADQRIEKKDKSLNEPVQFYITGAASQPYELVVNEVKKDRIIGYLASPKIKLARSN